MEKRSYLYIVSVIFSVIAVVHLVRALKGWEASVDGIMLPQWVSWAAFIVAGYLALRGFSLLHKKKFLWL